MQITNISEAKATLSHLIQVVQDTKEAVIIGKAGKPVAILAPYKESDASRTLGGSWEGKVKISDDFDDLGEEMADLFSQSVIFPEKS